MVNTRLFVIGVVYVAAGLCPRMGDLRADTVPNLGGFHALTTSIQTLKAEFPTRETPCVVVDDFNQLDAAISPEQDRSAAKDGSKIASALRKADTHIRLSSGSKVFVAKATLLSTHVLLRV